MDVLKQILPILFPLSLALLVMTMGMASASGDLLYVLRRPKLLLRALLAIDIVPPLAAILILSLFTEVPHAARAGIMLMAISPLPPIVPGKALKFGGEQKYVYGLQFVMALFAIVTVPLWGLALDAIFGAEAQFPVAVVARNVFIGVILPLAVGILLGRWLAPELAHRIAPIMAKLVLLLVVIAFIPILIGFWPRMMALIGDGTVLAIAGVIIIAIGVAHLLGPTDQGNKATLVFSAATRHPGIALALAGANHANPSVAAAVLLFMLVGLLVVTPYQFYTKGVLARTATAPS